MKVSAMELHVHPLLASDWAGKARNGALACQFLELVDMIEQEHQLDLR